MAGVIVQNKVIANRQRLLSLNLIANLDNVLGSSRKDICHLDAGMGMFTSSRPLMSTGHIDSSGNGNVFFYLIAVIFKGNYFKFKLFLVHFYISKRNFGGEAYKKGEKSYF